MSLKLLLLLTILYGSAPQLTHSTTNPHSEYTIRKILSSSNNQHSLFEAFTRTPKTAFLDRYIKSINDMRGKRGVAGFIQANDMFCDFLRKQLIRVANAYPKSVPARKRKLYLLYGKWLGPSDLRTDDLALEPQNRYVCCDKAIRSSVDLFVICGFSGGEYKEISRTRLDKNIQEIIRDSADNPIIIIPEQEISKFVDQRIYSLPSPKSLNVKSGKSMLEIGPIVII